MGQDQEHRAAPVQLGEGGVKVGRVGDGLCQVGGHSRRVERCWRGQRWFCPDAQILNNNNIIVVVDILLKKMWSMVNGHRPLVNHLNEDHVHEVEGRKSDGEVEASGQGTLSRPQLHILLRLLDSTLRATPTLQDQVNSMSSLACRVDKLSPLPSVNGTRPGRIHPDKSLWLPLSTSAVFMILLRV